jgi:glucose-6-phosphate 1-epimerase
MGCAEEAGRHQIPGAVELGAGSGGLACVRLTTGGAEAVVYLQGATVTHYQPAGQAPVLFVSRASRFLRGAPIRGGVPIVFPWFAQHATLADAPMHGFARTAPWRLAAAARDGAGAVEATFEVTQADATHAAWPHPYRLRYRVRLGQALEMALTVENTGTEPATFEEALHTYLAVRDVRQTAVGGLAGTSFVDKTDALRRKTQGPEPIRIAAETDRVYLRTTAACTVDDQAAGRRVVVEKEGSRTTVVWNPWIEKARAVPDLGDEEWQQMLCIETANALDDRLVLPPGGRHTLTTRLRVELLSQPTSIPRT